MILRKGRAVLCYNTRASRRVRGVMKRVNAPKHCRKC